MNDARARIDDVHAPVPVKVERVQEWPERGPLCGVEEARAVRGEQGGIVQGRGIVRVPVLEERPRACPEEERRRRELRG